MWLQHHMTIQRGMNLVFPTMVEIDLLSLMLFLIFVIYLFKYYNI